MKPKIVILRGKNASGKTTAFYNLKNYFFKDKKLFKNWIFVDNTAIKGMFTNLDDPKWKDYSKKILLEVIKTVLPLKRNIIVEETSKEMLNRNFSKEIRKYNYQIITFQFEVSLRNAILRDKKRVKEKTHPGLGEKKIKELREFHEDNLDQEGIIINTDNLNKEQVIKFIINELDI